MPHCQTLWPQSVSQRSLRRDSHQACTPKGKEPSAGPTGPDVFKSNLGRGWGGQSWEADPTSTGVLPRGQAGSLQALHSGVTS